MSKILLVEDEVLLADEISEWLQHEHYIVEVVRDGTAAYEMLRCCYMTPSSSIGCFRA